MGFPSGEPAANHPPGTVGNLRKKQDARHTQKAGSLRELTFPFSQSPLNTITYLKKSLFGRENNIYRLILRKNQGVWRQNRDTMSPGLGDVLHLVQMSSRQLKIRLQQGQSIGFIGEHN
ncbi:MAG: hypothetical protein AMS22_05320 [Thiotrichales bacterium SG8_50]|nr:MAG: hypothetical protein AMS22_05320 [Thiotrichales bacterium SG8_50]